jgi:hypothetical protein
MHRDAATWRAQDSAGATKHAAIHQPKFDIDYDKPP